MTLVLIGYNEYLNTLAVRIVLNNIPKELRERAQWVYADENKAPMIARTGALASVTDPSTWSTFEEVVRTGKAIGFVISKDDPYT